MKNKILYIALAVAMSSCSKSWFDVNTNPNSPSDVPPSTLLPTTTMGIGFATGNELGRAASILVQYNAGLANSALTYDNYNLAGSFDNQWNYEIYNGAINNLQIIIDKTKAESPYYSGIAKLQMAYIYSVTTDLWGDVPYSQGGQGMKYPQPRYDKQQDIYLGNKDAGIVSLFDLVKDGLADLNKATSSLKPGADDLVYKGDISKWKRVANTLLLKFAIQISNVNKGLATTEINAVIAGNNFISDNAYDFNIPFSTSLTMQNPMYQQDIAGSFKNNEMLSSRFLDLMRSMNDTVRLAKFYTKPNNQFLGFNNGSTVTAPTTASRSVYNTYVVGTTGEAPVRLLTHFQSAFILAEAAVTLGTTGDANAYFQEGIRASMSAAGMTATDIATYFTTNPTIVTLSGTNSDKVKQIITQKYIAWVGNGVESYNDYRRTGYPVLTLPLNTAGDNPSVTPKRFPYTAKEGNANPNQPNPRPKTDEKVWWGI
jgi:hypothetical protein